MQGPDHDPFGEGSRFHLEVRRGRTGHPTRPLLVPRYLVGSGGECDLRLGDDGLPAVHSIVHLDEGGPWIEAVADEPPLLVNGVAVESARLIDGDVIAVGGFDFVLRDSAAEDGEELESLAGAEIAELTAEELVDLLGSDVDLVEELESGVQRGEALLHAALAARRHAGEVDELVSRLASFAEELDGRSSRLAERERTVQHAAADLLEMHRALERRVESLEARLREGREERTRRAA